MGLGATHQKWVKTNRKFTLDEVYNILKNEGKLTQEINYEPNGLQKGIFVKGIGKYDVTVSIMGKKICCTEYVRKGEQAKTFGLDMLTKGWSTIADQDSIKNKEVVDAVGAEVERLFANRD